MQLEALKKAAERSQPQEHVTQYTFAATRTSVRLIDEGRILDLAHARAIGEGGKGSAANAAGLATSTALATQLLALAEIWRER